MTKSKLGATKFDQQTFPSCISFWCSIRIHNSLANNFRFAKTKFKASFAKSLEAKAFYSVKDYIKSIVYNLVPCVAHVHILCMYELNHGFNELSTIY